MPVSPVSPRNTQGDIAPKVTVRIEEASSISGTMSIAKTLGEYPIIRGA